MAQGIIWASDKGTSVGPRAESDEPKINTNTNTEETDYRPEEGLSPTAWRNLKIVLVVGGIVGNLIMRFGLVASS